VPINAAFVEEIHPTKAGDYHLRIRSGKEYTVTLSYKKNLREMAGSWIGADSFMDK
jgi:DNA-binding LytR/AlgR family response regulator